MAPNIDIIPHNKIDIAKWDACVADSPHQNVFMYTWALNSLCDDWSGIVLDDYKAVLPLPWRSKAGIKYVYQVPFLPRLSLMSKEPVANGKAILAFASRHFLLINTVIDNIHPADAWISREKTNYYIPLDKGYHEIAASYTPSCKKNIHKAVTRGCTIGDRVDTELVIDLYNAAYGKLQAHHTRQDYQPARQLVTAALQHNMAQTWNVSDTENNELLYGAITLHEKNRIYYWMGAPTPAGRQNRATYFFIDHLLQTYAGTGMIWDFEGSSIASVADFYRQFGPAEESFFEIRKFSLF